MKCRDTLWILTFFGFVVNYMLRININIAIVEMIKLPETEKAECVHAKSYFLNENTTSSIINVTIYSGKETTRNLILGSYYWMHWVTELPGGLLAHHYGTKQVFGLSNFLVAILTLFIPISNGISTDVLIGVRFLQGFIAGCMWPSMHSMVAKWIPPNERSKFVSSYLGSSVGTAFTYFLCGYIIDWYGWEFVFYVTGSLGVIWYLTWALLVYDTPQEHPWISNEEKEYIEKSIGKSLNRNKLPVPWKSLLTSKYVWINTISQWGANGAMFALMSHSPTYLKFIHGLPIKMTGVWSGIPHLARWIFAFVFGIFGQYQHCMKTSTIRKLATGMCTIGVGIFTIGLAFSGCNTILAITFLTITTTLQGGFSAGPLSAIIDMSPNFSGILQGMIGSVGVTPGFVYPLIVGYLTEKNQTSAQWQKIFLIVAALTCLCGGVDLLFGTSKLQPWNSEKQQIIKEIQPLQKETPEDDHVIRNSHVQRAKR
ncbi:hypothetical protein PGB90_006842 [Kerria lacca]